MNEYAELGWNGHQTRLRLIEGTTGERAIDVSKLRDQTGLITLDNGYGNTGACQSAITFIDGEKGILRYRGIPIEELAKHSSFVETAYLIIYEKLPTRAELQRFSDLLTMHELIHEDMKFHFEGFPSNAHPMAILSSMVNAAGCYYPDLLAPQKTENFEKWSSTHGLRPSRLQALRSARKDHQKPMRQTACSAEDQGSPA